jgi:PAS domain S-box-containing protein
MNAMKDELKEYRQYVATRLNQLLPYLQNYALGDFSTSIGFPDEPDEFTELIMGLNLMVDDVRDMHGEQEKTIANRRDSENRLTALNQLQGKLIRPGSLSKKMKRITSGLVDILSADFARIWIVNKGDLCALGCVHTQEVEDHHVCLDRNRCLHLIASSGRYTHLDGELHRRVPFGSYKIGRVAAAQEAGFMTNDVCHDERVHNRDWARELGLRSFAGYRLQSTTGSTIGVLALFSKHPFTSSDETILQTIARMASDVIQVESSLNAIRASEERLRTLFEGVRVGIVVYAPDGAMESGNPLAQELLGLTADQLQDKKAIDPRWKFLREDGSDMPLEEYPVSQVIESQNYLESQIVGIYRPGSGDIAWVLVSAWPEFDHDNHLTRIVVNFADITDRKHQEQKLQEYTREIERNNQQLEVFNRMAIGREERMIELKQQVNQLSRELERQAPYDISFAA